MQKNLRTYLCSVAKNVKVAYWLMKKEVAHTRYKSLIELCTDLDESNHLANWQKIRARNATYKSLATSLEMVKAIGEYIHSKTVYEISGSPFLSLMGDEAKDMKNRIELSVCVVPYYCWLHKWMFHGYRECSRWNCRSYNRWYYLHYWKQRDWLLQNCLAGLWWS